MGYLLLRESALVDPVVDLRVDPLVQLVNFRTQFRRVQVNSGLLLRCAELVELAVEHLHDLPVNSSLQFLLLVYERAENTKHSRGLVVDDGVGLLVPENRHGDAPLVCGVGFDIELPQELGVQVGVERALRLGVGEHPALNSGI
jgi:hypothetical protein